MSLAEYFASAKPFEQPIYEAVVEHLLGMEPLTVDFVSIGVLFKKARTFAELRPMRDRVRMAVLLSRSIRDPRVVKTLALSARFAIYFDLFSPMDVDEDVKDWLIEAYVSSPV